MYSAGHDLRNSVIFFRARHRSGSNSIIPAIGYVRNNWPRCKRDRRLRKRQRDQTADGKRLKLLAVVDEFTRECLAIEVERSLKAADVVSTLAYLFELRGAPRFVRSDNGPEFIAQEVKRWLEQCGSQTLYVEPGSPWENAYVESFNGKLQDEL